MNDLEIVEANPTGIELLETMTLQEWSDLGHRLIKLGNSLNWTLGDWAAFGKNHFGKLKEFAEANRLNYDALKKLAFVSSQVAASRRRKALSWGHHAEVADLPAKDQQQWLKFAEEGEWSVVDMREKIRGSLPNAKNALESDGAVIRTIGTKFDEFKSFLLGREDSWWDSERRQIWKERLRPVVEFYQKL